MLNKITRFFGLPEFTQTMVGNNTSQEDKVFYGTNETRPIYQTNVKNLKIKNGHYDGAYLKKGGILEPNGNGVYIDKRTGYKYDGEFRNGNAHGIGVLTLKQGEEMLMNYKGEVKNDVLFVKTTTKEQEQNTKRTLVFRSSKLDELQKGNYNTFETATWGEGRISNEDPLVTRYNGIKSVDNVIDIITQLPHVEKGEPMLLKLVFHQHGGLYGSNDIGLQDMHIDMILCMLWEKGYNDVEFSDLACHGPVSVACKHVAERVAFNGNVNSNKTFSIRASEHDRIVVNCSSEYGTTFRTFGNDNEARRRDKHTYTGYMKSMNYKPKTYACDDEANKKVLLDNQPCR